MEDIAQTSPGLPPTPTPAPSAVAIIPVVSALDYQNQQQQAATDAKAVELAGSASTNLLSYLQHCLNEAVNAKQLSGVTDKLLEAQRRRNGVHSAPKQAQLKKYNLPDYWVPLTQTKCIHTEAWLRDILMPYADKIWKLSPTEMPELPEHLMAEIDANLAMEAHDHVVGGGTVSDQNIHETKEAIIERVKKAVKEDAIEAAEAMESTIQDQQEECDFRGVFREFQANLTTYGTAFIKGPFTINKKFPKWVKDKRVVADKVIPSCSAPSPHDIYPAPWAKNENEGYIIERIKTYREGLSENRKLKYWQTTNVESLLKEHHTSASSTMMYGDQERATQENKAQAPIDNRIEIYQFTGPIPGYMLTEWGLKDCEDASDYNVEVLWSRNYILKVMPMWDEVGTKPYFKAVFKQIPGSFWGCGVPLLMTASQDRANMMMIAMLDNTNWGTGFIGWIDQTRLVNPDDVKEMHSKKWIPTFSGPGQNGAPMGMVEIQLKVSELSALYEKCLADADNESGVPAYMYGAGGSGQAGGTYSGLATLMNAAARGIKDCLLEIDQLMTRFIQHWADWCNQYVDDPKIKGDIRVLSSGSTGLFVAEMMLDKLDNLIAQAQPFIPITGPGLVISMLRQKAHALKVDTSMLPSDEEIEALKDAPTQPPPTPIKPSLSISAKWELLTPEEKAAFSSLVPELAQAEQQGAGPTSPQGDPQKLSVSGTGTPANVTPSGGPEGFDQVGGPTGTKPLPPIKGQGTL